MIRISKLGLRALSKRNNPRVLLNPRSKLRSIAPRRSTTPASKCWGSLEQEWVREGRRVLIWTFVCRVGHSISYDDYLVWKSQQPIPPEASQPESEAANGTSEEQATQQGEPYPPSFDAIVELISTGRTDEIPGIKDIPLQVRSLSTQSPFDILFSRLFLTILCTRSTRNHQQKLYYQSVANHGKQPSRANRTNKNPCTTPQMSHHLITSQKKGMHR